MLVIGLPLPASAGNKSRRRGEREALVVAKQALAYFLSGKYAIAAELYRRAHELAPHLGEYRYGAGRAAHKAGRFDAAEKDYVAVIEATAADDPLRIKTRHRLAELRKERKLRLDAARRKRVSARKRAATRRRTAAAAAARNGADERAPRPSQAKRHGGQASATPAPRNPTVHAEQTRQGTAKSRQPAELGVRRIVAIAGLSAGLVAVLGGGVVGATAMADQVDLDAALDRRDANDQVIGMDKTTAHAQQTSINERVVAAWVLAGVGAAAIGAAAYALWRPTDEPDVALYGTSLAVRF